MDQEKYLKMNFFDYKPEEGNYIIVGNPPFGLRGNTALRFLNHSATFADIAAFILPPLFNSSGKGAPRKRVIGYNLVHSENLPLNSFIYLPDGKEIEIATIFQIWSRVHQGKIEENVTCNSFIKIYSLSDGGTPGTTRNKNMLNSCDVYLPSTCFDGMHAYSSFEELPRRRGYGIVILKDKEIFKICFLKLIIGKKKVLNQQIAR